jgi:hypothetical protein
LNYAYQDAFNHFYRQTEVIDMRCNMLSAHNRSISALIPGLIAVLLVIVGCGGGSYEANAPQNHPANPDAPQAASETPPNALAETATPTQEGAEAPRPIASLSEQGEQAVKAMLDAYFAIGDQLAANVVTDVNTNAMTLMEAFHSLENETPSGDPHFWHTHAQGAEAIHDQAHELAEVSDITAARKAYGVLSDALNRLVAAVGVPSGYEKPVYGFICGMYPEAPQNGVWLQIGAEARNPYFGGAMLKCHREMFQAPTADGKPSEGASSHSSAPMRHHHEDKGKTGGATENAEPHHPHERHDE